MNSFAMFRRQLQKILTIPSNKFENSVILRSSLYQYSLSFRKTPKCEILLITLQYLNYQPVKLNQYVVIDLQKKLPSTHKRLKLITERNRIEFISKNATLQTRNETSSKWINGIMEELCYYESQLIKILAYNGEIGRKISRQTIKINFQDQQKMLQAKLQLERNITDIISKDKVDFKFRVQEFGFDDYSKIDTEKKSNLFIIDQIEEQKNGNSQHKTGGVCTIQKCSIDFIKFHALTEDDQTSSPKTYQTSRHRAHQTLQHITLAKKQIRKNEAPPSIKDSSDLREKLKQKQQELNNRFYHEIDILKHISKKGRKQYLLDYYIPKKDTQTYYVEFVDMNLNEFLYYYGENLSHREIINICQQVVSIVIDLHGCGVIHRDLKPTNFMVKYDQNKGNIDVKLIDFSDSYVKDLKKDICIYSTIPYSPLECSKNNKKFKEFGLDKQEIDYWSIGILLSQIVFGNMPVSYSCVFSKDIHLLWDQDFLHNPIANARQNGYKIIHNAFKRLNQSLIDPNPNNRLSHKKAQLFLYCIRNYYQKITSDNILDVRCSNPISKDTTEVQQLLLSL